MDPFGTGKLVLFQGGILNINIVPGSFLIWCQCRSRLRRPSGVPLNWYESGAIGYNAARSDNKLQVPWVFLGAMGVLELVDAQGWKC